MKLMLGLIAVVLFVCIFAPTQTAAQGAFYVEETKEGRIYVFNDPKQYQLFKDSGELEVRITRIGAGPNGETIYFDSENAIHMYNFKHNLPAEVIIKAEEKKPKMTFGWKDGKTTFESENATLILSNRIQFRYTLEDPATSGVPVGQTGDAKGSFRIRRAKTKMEGWFFDKNLTYELQLNWADIANVLEDAQLTYDITRGKKLLFVKAGQYKVPFGRQELTSSGSQEFVDRSAVSNTFARGRDQGVQLSGLPMNGKLDWRLGVFNGNGRTRTSNDNADYQVDARVTFAPWEDPKYSEGDTDDTQRPAFAAAIQYEKNKAFDSITLAEPDREIFGGDLVLKYRGIFAFFDYYDAETENTLTGAKVDSNGYNIQGGYFIVPKRFEVAVRYSVLDPDSNISGNDRTERGVAVGYFWLKHNLKLQSDYRQLEDEAKSITNDEWRVQLQYIF